MTITAAAATAATTAPMKKKKTKRPCRCCGATRWLKSRGLCQACWTASRHLYAPLSPAAAAAAAQGPPPAPTRGPAAPTPHPPGSPGKVEELTRRLWAGERLWHPLDAGCGAAAVVAPIESPAPGRQVPSLYGVTFDGRGEDDDDDEV